MPSPADDLVVDFDQTLWIVPEWIEQHCIVPDLFALGEPFVMYDWQLFCTVNHYRVRPDAEAGMGARAFHYRRSQVVLPQKTGKGPWSATIILNEAVGPAVFAGFARRSDGYACIDHGCPCGWEYAYGRGEAMGIPWPTPLIQLTATSEGQTDNVYRPLQSMIRNGPLGDIIDPAKVGEMFTRLPGGGRIDKVTSSARSRLGNPVTFVLQDETGIYTKQNKMVDVADTQLRGLAGMNARALETTNAWDPSQQSTAQMTAKTAAATGDIFRHHPMPPKKLKYADKAQRRKIHVFVYRGSAHVNLDSIEAQAVELLGRDPAQAERFFGNRSVESSETYFDGDAWDRSALPMPVASGELVAVGFDGSDKDARGHADQTWFRCCRVSDGYLFTPRFPDGRPMRWKHPDDPEASKAWQVPRGEVHAAWQHLKRTYRVVRMYADPPYWQSEIDEWAAEDPDVVIRWETYRPKQMSAALEQLRTDVNAGDVLHDGDPEVAEHTRNAKSSPRANGTLIVKPSEEQKIDAKMADALAYEARNDFIAAGGLDEPPPNTFTYD